MPDKPTEIDQQNAFLSAYGDTVHVEQAAARAGISSVSHYRWLKTNPAYVDAWGLTIQHLVDRLIAAGFHRAEVGVPRLLTHKGEIIMVPAINKYTGLIQLDGKGKKVMMPLIEWTFDHRAWKALLEAWDPAKFNRGAIASRLQDEGGKVKGKRIRIVDERRYPRMAQNGRA